MTATKTPTTVKKWLQQLPDGYRERALRQCVNPRTKAHSMLDAINKFEAHAAPTEEGQFFWLAVYKHYKYRPPLPPLP